MQDELDILRKVGRTAISYGSLALSEILARRINLGFPSTNIVTFQEFPSKLIKLEEINIAVFSKILLGLEGEVAFILDEKSAFKVIDLFYKIRDEEKKVSAVTENGLSLIKEIGHIVIGSYLTTLSLMFKRLIVSQLPSVIRGSTKDILNIILSPYKEEDYTNNYLIEMTFEEPQEKLRGCFYLVLTPYAVKEIEDVCKEILEETKCKFKSD